MHGIFPYIDHENQPTVGEYTIVLQLTFDPLANHCGNATFVEMWPEILGDDSGELVT